VAVGSDDGCVCGGVIVGVGVGVRDSCKDDNFRLFDSFHDLVNTCDVFLIAWGDPHVFIC